MAYILLNIYKICNFTYQISGFPDYSYNFAYI